MKALVLLSALLFWSSSFAGEAKTVRLLTIGNSFSANATHYLGDLAKAGGHTLIHRPLVVGGASFQVHAEKAQKHESDATDKAGLYTSGLGLRESLAADTWDFVTIQQSSIKSHDFITYQPHAGWLHEYILKHAPKAKLLVHQTWPYRKDDVRFANPSGKAGEPKTQEAMYRGLTAAHDRIAAELDGRVIPVGDAFFMADTDSKWGYQTDTAFDFKTISMPTLPKQMHSLHMGWQWKKQPDGLMKLSMDGHHASILGEYLGACVWYEVLFGESVVGNSFVLNGIEEDDTRFLQEVAHKAVQARAK